MMTSSNGNIFRVTGPLCWEFTGPGEFPTQRPVTRSFDVFFDLLPKKRLSKQSWGWWCETLSHPSRRHRNDTWTNEVMMSFWKDGRTHETTTPVGVMWGINEHHEDVIKWKHFPRYWPFVQGIHRSPASSPHKGQWHGALVFFFGLRLIKRLSKQSRGLWFGTLSHPLWRHCNVTFW